MRTFAVRLAVLLAVSVLPFTTAAAQPGVTAEAKAVIDRHLKAAGASDATKAIQSVRAIGTLSMPAQGMTGTIEMFQARPNKMLLKAEISGIGKMENGFDGERGWSIDPITGPTLLSGKELEQTKFDAVFGGPFEDLARYKSITVAGVETFDGRKMTRLDTVNVNGDASKEFFDLDTGLHAGTIETKETMMGAIEVTSVMRDYRKVGNGLEPHELVQRMMGMEQIVRIEKIEINGAKPDTFALPAVIKALIK